MDKDSNCLFCKIVDKHIPSNMVKDHTDYVAIRDINPQAPTHVLVIPKKHVKSISNFEDAPMLGRLFQAAKDIAHQEGLSRGFRLVVNTGEDGGQTVDHLHIHVLGGRSMTWPPG